MQPSERVIVRFCEAGWYPRCGPVWWIRYWSDPSTSLSKDLTCFMLLDDGCMILWQDSFGVHLALCHVVLFQRCSHYEMPVSFLSVTVCVRDSRLCPIQSISFLYTVLCPFLGEILWLFFDFGCHFTARLLSKFCQFFCVVVAMSSLGERELYNIRKFDGTNFSMWKEQIKDALV